MLAPTLWALVRRLRRYEPALVEYIEGLVLRSPVEQARALAHRACVGSDEMETALEPGERWRLFEWAGVVAGPCRQRDPGAFSFLMHGPKHSAFYGQLLEVTVYTWYCDLDFYRESTCRVTRWPSGAPIWHPNHMGDGLLEFYDDESYMVMDGVNDDECDMTVQLQQFIMRVSCLLAAPNPNETKFEMSLEERDNEAFDEIEGDELTDEMIDATYEKLAETPLPDILNAPNIWFACEQNKTPEDFYIEAVQFNRQPTLTNLEEYLPRKPDASISGEIVVPVRVLLPCGLHSVEAADTCGLRKLIASTWGYLTGVGCICLAHHGREISGPLAQLGVLPGDVLVVVQKDLATN